ncbi:MAG: sulfite exporter TauE/SafE family protein [Nitrospinae bacterium]|nr:sulfite exporter TauE/SafE family protein [Nitrospinota bacterium]MBL7019823.1 sulfite exporter TauE/SafE family protein [Nitrospinaceae bacterium]
MGRERRQDLIILVLLGIIVGILSSGSGLGGGFLVVPLLIFLGREAKLAVGTSFVFILMVAISSVLAHYRLGNVDIKTGLLLALGGVVGAQIGPHLLQHLSDQNYKRIFSALLVITAVWLFASSFNGSKG